VTYSRAFYHRTSDAAGQSARKIVPHLVGAIQPASVLDVGAGGGAWLKAWADAGVTDVRGVDAASPEDCGYMMPPDTYSQLNLERPFDLGRRFSLVQSLEVAEHLPAYAAEGFVGALCDHADIIFFSAAPPGQGGIHHINERPYGYWRDLFARRRYRPIDWLRSVLAADHDVAWWYRYNVLLYANEAGCASLPYEIRAARLADNTALTDVAPLAHRIRRAVLRPLPWQLVTGLAIAGERLIGSRISQ
jgi:hypothetical protein